ncbi:MAG: ATPase domain-containing protein [Chloroflexota bacterium]
MIDRMESGQPQLDAVFGGGLPAAAITVIAGTPGTGKTMLAEQYVFHNATVERPAIYFATTSEPLEKLVRFGQELTFFDPGRVGTAVMYDTLFPELASGGLQAVIERIIEVLRDMRPGIVVFDSFKALRAFAADELAYRTFVSELAGRLSASPVSSLWVGEYHEDELMGSVEAAVADTILSLRSRNEGQRTLRQLRVEKVRGSQFLSGDHAYRLSASGLSVWPRLADPVDDARPTPSEERISLGSDEIDGLLDGGVWAGTATLAMGPAGSGKTMLGLDFLAAGARAGRPGVLATLQESASQLARVLAGRTGDQFGKHVTVHRRSPVDMYIDEWVYGLLETADAVNAELIVVDSLSDLRFASSDQTRFEEYVYSLGQRCARNGTTLLMTLETRPPFAFAATMETSLSHVVDNIVVVGYDIDGADVRRAIHVLKSRGSAHDPSIREFRIEADGVHVGDPIAIDVDPRLGVRAVGGPGAG